MMRNERTGVLVAVVCLTALAVSGSPVAGQSPLVASWERAFGTADFDEALAVDSTSDGGFGVVGWSGGDGGLPGDPIDAVLVRTDENGEKVWEKRFRDKKLTFGRAVCETFDGGFVIAGDTFEPGSTLSIFALRTDRDGGEIWRLPRDFSSATANAVVQTEELGFAIAGTEGGLGYLLKVDTSGNRLWKKTFGSVSKSLRDGFTTLRETSDGGLILGGWTDAVGDNESGDIFVLRTDANGVREWERTLGALGLSQASAVLEVDGGDILVAGLTGFSQRGGTGDAFALRFDREGVPLWSRTYDTGVVEHARSIAPIGDGRFLLAGHASESTGSLRLGSDVLLLEIDGDGGVVWESVVARPEAVYPLDMAVAGDGGFVLAGGIVPVDAENADFALLKFEPERELAAFRRGDTNADGRVNLSDAVATLNFLFVAGAAPPCGDAADADDTGELNLTDGVYSLNFLFLAGPSPPAPGPESCGADETDDAIECGSFPPCE